ncbi:hypothetical protein JL720_10326 [Aureococcus anophagefferens]|nr:hypothetical protein JL720_10326 [Aureococcus anophagefferens]
MLSYQSTGIGAEWAWLSRSRAAAPVQFAPLVLAKVSGDVVDRLTLKPGSNSPTATIEEFVAAAGGTNDPARDAVIVARIGDRFRSLLSEPQANGELLSKVLKESTRSATLGPYVVNVICDFMFDEEEARTAAGASPVNWNGLYENIDENLLALFLEIGWLSRHGDGWAWGPRLAGFAARHTRERFCLASLARAGVESSGVRRAPDSAAHDPGQS